ncbi:MAG: flagellar filament capping protein FliD [Gemmatimonadota bacterium]|nr:flagellar filament capping protein FliD [Gemmatimonadota bacterium]
MTTPITFTGLASGMDTESIISAQMENARIPIQRLENESALLGLKQEAFREANTQLLNLQNESLNLRLESTFSSRIATSGDPSKVQATVAASAAKTNHRVTVHSLAQEASVNSQRYLSRASILGSNTVGINALGSVKRINAPGAGRLQGGVVLANNTTLGDLGLAGDFTLRIDPDGTDGSRSNVLITGLDASTKMSELMDKINEQIDSVKAQLIYDEPAGGTVMQLGSDYAGLDVGFSGAVAEAVFGLDAGAVVTSAGGPGLGSARAKTATSPMNVHQGTANIVSTDGLAGSITGTVNLAAISSDVSAITLTELGVSEFDNFKIDPDASGATGLVAVTREDGSLLKGTDTIADLIKIINESVPNATAQLVDGSGGPVYLRITANEGGRDITLSQSGSTNGIIQKILGLGDSVTSSNATTDSGDATLMQSFYRRGSLEPESRRVVSSGKDNFRIVGVSDLIDGVTVVGAAAGEVFTPGTARVQVSCNDRMASDNSERLQVFGRRSVTDSAYATGLGLDANGSGKIGINKNISELNAAGAFALDSGGTGITAGQFVVGETTLTITQDEIDDGFTLADVLARINTTEEGLVVSYEAASDRFIASRNEYGQSSAIHFGSYTALAGESNILQVMGLAGSTPGVLNSGGQDTGKIDADATLNTAGLSIRPTSGMFSINGIGIEIDITADTLYEVLDKINNSAAGVTASLDANTSRVNLVQKVNEDTVADYIQVGSISDTSNLISALRITGGSTADGSIKGAESIQAKNTVGTERQQASFEVDGFSYTRNTNTVNDITPGITYELMGVSSGSVNITVSGDAQKSLDALASWISQYNKTILMLNPEPVASQDKYLLEPLTASERSSSTYEELIDRLDKYESLNKSEAIRKDSGMQRILNQLQSDTVTPVEGLEGKYTTLASLGINSGSPGAPLRKDYLGVLVADSTDFDVIRQTLDTNQTLLDALDKNDESVSALFRQSSTSKVTLKGTIGYDESTPLANDVSFDVFNGVSTANINISAGQYSKSQILSMIVGQLERSGITDIDASFDSSDHLQFVNEKNSGSAYLRLIDTTNTAWADRMNTRFGISSGSYSGPEAESKDGLAEKLYNDLRQATGVTGYIRQQISFGGTYGQGTIFDEIASVQEQISQMEERVNQKEQRLRSNFLRMEKVIAGLQEQQNALAQFIGSTSSSSE